MNRRRMKVTVLIVAGLGAAYTGAQQPTAEASSYCGWPSQRMANNLVEVQVVPSIGGRVIKQYGISGDPQIVRMGDLWVMFYFGAFWQPGAFDTFACSTDLVHWTKWTGPNLIQSSEPWDAQYAHKPWLVKHDGVVYHFYCAVGNQGRVIALATSKDFGKGSK